MHSLEIVKLFNHSDTEICAANMMHNNNFGVLTVCPMEDEIIMLHHFEQKGRYSRTKEPKIVALSVFGPLSYVVHFKIADTRFGYVQRACVQEPRII